MITSGGAPSLPPNSPQAGLPERSNQSLIPVSVVSCLSGVTSVQSARESTSPASRS